MNRIKELRQQKGWLQDDLALILNISRQAVSHYETGMRDIDSAMICRLCEIFDCSADYLLGRTNIFANEISEEEAEILKAFRDADDRSREMVRLALAPFMVEATTGESAK